MSIGRDLLAEHREAEVNPLALLGLTRELLDVGLSDSELLVVTRKFAKTLLAEVHEDRIAKTERTEALQRRFSLAMTCLKDVASFASALTALRTEASLAADLINRSTQSVEDLRLRTRDCIERTVRMESETYELKADLRRLKASARGHLERANKSVMSAHSRANVAYDLALLRFRRRWGNVRKKQDEIRQAREGIKGMRRKLRQAREGIKGVRRNLGQLKQSALKSKGPNQAIRVGFFQDSKGRMHIAACSSPMELQDEVRRASNEIEAAIKAAIEKRKRRAPVRRGGEMGQ